MTIPNVISEADKAEKMIRTQMGKEAQEIERTVDMAHSTWHRHAFELYYCTRAGR